MRAVAKTLLQAYVDEDYHRLCAQFAPGTFTEWLAAAKVGSCERLFSAMTHFEAPSPQQINAAEVRVHGDRAKIVFREQGVEPYLLRRINGHWLISNEAEVDGAPARSAAEPAADRA